jgi:3-oxoacyl-[acyl-carrier protein] reductase
MITIDLSGKNALVTGGTRGIGRAISYRLAEAGANTSAAFRTDEATARDSLKERQLFGTGMHRNYRADVGVADQITQLAEQVMADFDGRVDILVLNAAAQGGSKVGEIDPTVWQRAFDVNLTGPFLLIQALLPTMPQGGSIVTIASGAGHDPMAGGFATYGATKAGLIMFTQDLAQDVGPRGIRANVVSPGGTDTSFGIASAHGDRKPREVGHNALRRVGVPDDVAGVVLFLCSHLASFVTGQAIRVNGAAT